VYPEHETEPDQSLEPRLGMPIITPESTINRVLEVRDLQRQTCFLAQLDRATEDSRAYRVDGAANSDCENSEQRTPDYPIVSRTEFRL
jgi:hypothetical protein